MRFLITIWQFTRPHTIIGSALSISALYFLSIIIAFPNLNESEWSHYLPAFLLTLGSALFCNVFITGLNQLKDVALDQINKPYLPIPSGKLTIQQAKWIIGISCILSLALAYFNNWGLFLLIIAIQLLGIAYSVPPLSLKKHHVLAAVCILLVRGILVNLGMTAQFLLTITGKWFIPVEVWPLTLFITGFSIGIAWFKDIPDTKGDQAFNIQTLALTITPERAFQLGVAVVTFSYLSTMLVAAFLPMHINPSFFYVCHTLLLAFFLWNSARLSLKDAIQIRRFYKIFWLFFFIEYIVYPLSFYLF